MQGIAGILHAGIYPALCHARATVFGVNTNALNNLIVSGTDEDVILAYRSLAERAAEAAYGFEDEICVVDVETTGYDPERDVLIEIAAAVMRGPEVLGRFQTFVDPCRRIPDEITRLTGITDADVEGAPSAGTAVARLAELVGGRPILAHNAAFDRRFLEHVAGSGAITGTWLDSLVLARVGLPRLRSHRLPDLAEAFAPDPERHAHRAGDDVEALCAVYRVALAGIADLDPGVLRRLGDLDAGGGWPEQAVLKQVAGAIAAGKGSYDLRRVRRKRVTADRVESLNDAWEIACVCPPAEEIVGEFSADGLAGRMYPGFEQRSEQVQMAEAVREAFGGATHLAIEAGTGVGKSMAYLVPAAKYALANGVGIGVATKTNALMDQLVHHELPRLAEALAEAVPDAVLAGGMPGGADGGSADGTDGACGARARLRHAALKGYEHYLCLRKLERLASEIDPASSAAGQVAANVGVLLAWVSQSSWGDLDSVNLHWGWETKEVRLACQANRADCLLRRCRYWPSLCYLHGARRRAASSHIVVTNHALLFRDVVAQGGILPPLRHWVLDEAHSAESEARKQLTLDTGYAELSAALAALSRSRGGVLETIRRKLTAADPAMLDLAPPGAAVSAASAAIALPGPGPSPTLSLIELLASTQDEVQRAQVLGSSFFDYVKDLAQGLPAGDYDSGELWIDAALRETGRWGVVASTGRSLAKRLDALLGAGRQIMTLVEQQGSGLLEEQADLASVLSRLADQRNGLITVIDGADETLVYSAVLDRRRDVGIERLVAAKLDVGETLAEDLYPRVDSVIYTSATIATGDSFEHFAQSVGLDRLDAQSWHALKLASSYDFERQMTVFLPFGLAEPVQSGYLADIERLLESVHLATGGGVLTLFTNRRDMEALFSALEPKLKAAGLGLIAQRRGISAKSLRDEFIAEKDLSLFALKSFWEGFDAKGDTLRCVVVPKLPFGRPTDPLARERELRAGGAAWRRYSLPEAVIELKQAAGRLIRSSTDTGCLVIADARVANRNYGRNFLEALPVTGVRRLPASEVADEIARHFGR